MIERFNKFLPSLAQCWVIIFFILVVGGIGVGTLLTLITAALGYDVTAINPLVSYVLPLLPAFIYIYIAGGRSMEVVLPIERVNSAGVPLPILYLLLFIAIIAIGFVSEPLSAWIPMPEYMQELFEKILSDSFWAFMTTVVAAPVLEEILLRGVIERGLLRTTTPMKAIFWSALFFAVIHLNPWQAIGAFIAGLFLGWIYWRTHSLVACIFIHAVNNGIAYFLQLFNPDLPADTTYKDLLDIYFPNIYCIVFVIFAVSLAVILNYLNKRLPTNNFE